MLKGKMISALVLTAAMGLVPAFSAEAKTADKPAESATYTLQYTMKDPKAAGNGMSELIVTDKAGMTVFYITEEPKVGNDHRISFESANDLDIECVKMKSVTK